MEEEFQREEDVTQYASTSAPTIQSATPPTTKRLKKHMEDKQKAMMSSALDLLKTASTKLDQESLHPANEIDAFFKFVTAKVHNYSPDTQKAVQHSIFEILMKADRGLFEWPSTSYQYSHPLSSYPPHQFQSSTLQPPASDTSIPTYTSLSVAMPATSDPVGHSSLTTPSPVSSLCSN